MALRNAVRINEDRWMHRNEKLLFLNSWLRNPSRIGAMVPSGRALAERMALQVDPAGGPVIELGPGTGSFTRAMLARGLPEHRLALVEADPAFARLLSSRYPSARLLAMDAAYLGRVGALFGEERARTVVSGLPLLSLPLRKVVAILEGVFDAQLHPDGRFIQFSYGFRFPVPATTMRALGLEVVRCGAVIANLPPAFLYAVRRCADAYRHRSPACARASIEAPGSQSARASPDSLAVYSTSVDRDSLPRTIASASYTSARPAPVVTRIR